jgi:hypothetical protein
MFVNSINRQFFITDTQFLYCEVGTPSLYITQVRFAVQLVTTASYLIIIIQYESNILYVPTSRCLCYVILHQ